MIKNPALRAVAAFMTPTIVLYGLYIQVHGDYSPGGGFQGGVIVASAALVYAILFGSSVVLRLVPIRTMEFVSAVGVLLYIAVGIVTVFLGGEFLSYRFLLFDPITEQKLGIFIVELGVGMTVCGSMMSIYFSFASRKK